MKLPNRERAQVPKRKLTKYLLSLSHPVGGPKARFFRSHGFDDTSVDRLRAELLGVAQRGEVVETEETAHGTKYVIVGSLLAPGGEEISVRTVWIIETPGVSDPRFVTAYPA